MTTIQKIEDSQQSQIQQDVILGLTLGEEIIQFNRESEQCTGYLREEVLHKKFFEILVPIESTNQWKQLLETIKQTMWIDHFVLPLKTKDNQTVMVQWTGFLVKDERGSINNLCIFGKPVQTELKETQPVVLASQEVTQQPEEQTRHIQNVESVRPFKIKEESIQHDQKKIKFAQEKQGETRLDDTYAQEEIIKPREILGKFVDKTAKKFNVMHDSIQDLTRKYESVIRRLSTLEKKYEELEKWRKESLPTAFAEKTYEQPEIEEGMITENNIAEQQLEDETHTFFSDLFGFKRQQKMLSVQRQQMEVRTKELEAFEARLLRDQTTLNSRVEEFSKWREKLELLESAIEKRRLELMKQENFILENSTTPLAQGTIKPIQVPPLSSEQTPPQCNETLEKIPQSAAIIQRGVLKQINDSFLELLGYPREEIVDKSFFDFIALEGLADVEKYYLDRLTGESVSVYRTVFSTKDNHKISVEVNIKQTIYNGEKAEIAIITCI